VVVGPVWILWNFRTTLTLVLTRVGLLRRGAQTLLPMLIAHHLSTLPNPIRPSWE
jgi:hypothetical protein